MSQHDDYLRYQAEKNGDSLRGEPFILLGEPDSRIAGFVRPDAVVAIRFDRDTSTTLVDLVTGLTIPVRGDVSERLLMALRDDCSFIPDGYVEIYSETWEVPDGDCSVGGKEIAHCEVPPDEPK